MAKEHEEETKGNDAEATSKDEGEGKEKLKVKPKVLDPKKYTSSTGARLEEPADKETRDNDEDK